MASSSSAAKSVVPNTAISFEAVQDTVIPTMEVQSSNLMENLNVVDYPTNIQIMVECLKHSPLATALTITKPMPQSLVNLAFSTVVYTKENDKVRFEVLGGRKLTVDKKTFCLLLGLDSEGFFVNPSAEDLIAMFNQMGFTPYMTKISQFKKNRLPTIWNFFFTVFKRCLCGRNSGLDVASQLFLSALYGVYFNVNVDYGSILWYEFLESLKITKKESELSSHRYWVVILESAYAHEKISYEELQEPPMSVLPFLIPTKFAPQTEFSFVGQVPEDMLKRIPAENAILIAYKKTLVLPYPTRVIPSYILKQIDEQVVKPSKKRKETSEAGVSSEASPSDKVKKGKRSKRTKKAQSSQAQQLRDESDDDAQPISKLIKSPLKTMSSKLDVHISKRGSSQQDQDVSAATQEELQESHAQEIEETVTSQDPIVEEVTNPSSMEEDIPDYGSQRIVTIDTVAQPSSEPPITTIPPIPPVIQQPIPPPPPTQSTPTQTIVPTSPPQSPPQQPPSVITQPQSPPVITTEGPSPDTIFGNLGNLNVNIHVSHVVQQPPTYSKQFNASSHILELNAQEETQDEEVQNETEAVADDDYFELEPYVFVDADVDLPDNQLMSIKQ